VIFNDGEKTQKVRSTGGRLFQRRCAVMDMARLENLKRVVTGGRERARQEEHRVERDSWMVRSSLLLPCHIMLCMFYCLQ